MKKERKRLDTAGPASSLTSNPFSQLGETIPEKLREDSTPALPPEEQSETAPVLSPPSREVVADRRPEGVTPSCQCPPSSRGVRDAAPQSFPKPGFRIERTRKGGYPIFLEKRGSGKTVTVIRNVSGDTDALLSLLKKHCAAGGKAFADLVEIQGDHRAKVEAFLKEKGH